MDADPLVQDPGQDQRVKGGNDTHGVDDHITTINVPYALYKANHGITSKVGKQLRGLASHFRIEGRGALQRILCEADLCATAPGWLSSPGSGAN